MKHFKIGLRTFKTATAVAICLLISHLISRDSPVLSCLAAVYCLRTDAASSYHFSKHRIFGTSIGVFVSIGAIFIQNILTRTIFSDTLLVFIGVIAVIIFCNMTKHPEGIITSVSTFLIICFNTPATETIHYAFFRIFDVLIGASVAVLVDFSLPGKKS
ncbi:MULTISPECIES: aromatic acid exporter family protein [unclassified Granulicatella]|uniref:FUSC family protein n=1 Tax=unclassified Granulicatella TaxID=2630493 RepID=UPI00142F80F7|nr:MULTISPECIES: aromatic acid exporter family protein [unclassified Granulicatella]MBF0779637.1 FUSC family protein [Granulicatella sp. 19428wC4_WM01]